MSIKTATIIAALAAITITTGRARIGETMEQAVQRYGQPVEITAEWMAFRKGEFRINVQFYQGHIDTIEYIKITGYNSAWKSVETAELSEVEVDNFLKANSSDTWKPSSWHRWFASNLFARQEYFTHLGDWTKNYYGLLIWTSEAQQRYANNKRTQETAAQAGF